MLIVLIHILYVEITLYKLLFSLHFIIIYFTTLPNLTYLKSNFIHSPLLLDL